MRIVTLAGAAALLLLLPAGATAQQEGSGEAAGGEREAAEQGEVIYTREVFHYQAGRRPDPFRSLLGTAEMGIRPDDLTLVGVIYSTDPRSSVAVLLQQGATRRLRVRVGDRVGSMTVAAIYPRRIDVVVDELGVARRESLQLRPVRTQATEGDSETGSPQP